MYVLIVLCVWFLYKIAFKENRSPASLSVNIEADLYVQKSERRAIDWQGENVTYVNTHEDIQHCSTSQYIVYSCGLKCDSLAQMEIGIVVAYLVAVMTNRAFVIANNNNSSCNIGKFFLPNDYNWKECGDYLSDQTIDRNGAFKWHRQPVSASAADQFHIHTFLGYLLTEKIIVLDINWTAFSVLKYHLTDNCPATLRWIAFAESSDIFFHTFHSLFRPISSLSDSLDHLIRVTTLGKKLVCGLVEQTRDRQQRKSKPDRSKRLIGQSILNFLKHHYSNSSKYVTYLATNDKQLREQSSTQLSNYIYLFNTLVTSDLVGRNQNTGCKHLYFRIFEQSVLTLCDAIVFKISLSSQIVLSLREKPGGLFLYNETRKILVPTEKGNLSDFIW